MNHREGSFRLWIESLSDSVHVLRRSLMQPLGNISSVQYDDDDLQFFLSLGYAVRGRSRLESSWRHRSQWGCTERHFAGGLGGHLIWATNHRRRVQSFMTQPRMQHKRAAVPPGERMWTATETKSLAKDHSFHRRSTNDSIRYNSMRCRQTSWKRIWLGENFPVVSWRQGSKD